MRRVSIAAVLAAAAIPACASPRVIDLRRGIGVEIADVAAAFQDYDVVCIGEIHNREDGHRLQLELIAALHRLRDDLVISMEMFERGDQAALDGYLAGEIEEAEFLARARTWSRYAEHYRPIVELARRQGLQVLAANLPRDLAAQVAKTGVEAVAGEPHAARATTAPRDDYWRRFGAAMRDSGHLAESESLYRYYQAQCLKDDTMAETIVDYLRAAHAAGRDPLVVHLCGRFHCEYRAGTVARILSREPELSVGVVSMRIAGEEDERPARVEGLGIADFVLELPPNGKPPPG